MREQTSSQSTYSFLNLMMTLTNWRCDFCNGSDKTPPGWHYFPPTLVVGNFFLRQTFSRCPQQRTWTLGSWFGGRWTDDFFNFNLAGRPQQGVSAENLDSDSWLAGSRAVWIIPRWGEGFVSKFWHHVSFPHLSQSPQVKHGEVWFQSVYICSTLDESTKENDTLAMRFTSTHYHRCQQMQLYLVTSYSMEFYMNVVTFRQHGGATLPDCSTVQRCQMTP